MQCAAHNEHKQDALSLHLFFEITFYILYADINILKKIGFYMKTVAFFQNAIKI